MIESEQSVIGSILKDNNRFDDIGFLDASDFVDQDNREIFSQMQKLRAENKPCDWVTLSTILHNKADYIAKLHDYSSPNFVTHAELIKENSLDDDLMRSVYKIMDLLSEKDPSRISKAQEIVNNIGAEISKDELIPVRSLVGDVLEELDERSRQQGFTGIDTGFTELNKKLCGLQDSDLIIIAARPSMGKTSLAMNIVEHAAISEKKTCAVFSLEMSRKQLITRNVCSLGEVDAQRARTGNFVDEDWPRITQAGASLAGSSIFIDDTPALSISQLKSRARRLNRDHDLDLIVVDYIQLMRGEGDNRTQEIGSISRGLKALAKELDIPVVALSQLNRTVESRVNKRPMMSDLRESGEIEQDADVIMFIYRDEVYNPDTVDKGLAEIIISKQRNGPIGMIYLAFQNQFTRFDNFYGEVVRQEAPMKKWAGGFDRQVND